MLALAQKGQLDEAAREMELLLDLGFPPELFLAGPQELTGALKGLEIFHPGA